MENAVCFKCGTKNEYEMRTLTRQYIGDGYSFSMDVELPFCKKCGALITMEDIEQEIAKKVNKKIRESKGIIQKEEIRGILSKYNVSQKMLSRLLGWGEITLTRYVTGGYTPNAVNSEKLKSLNNPYIFQKMLNDNESDKFSYSFEKLHASVNSRLKEIEEQKGKIFQVVNWFLSKTSDENPITNLALQKLLYFSQSWYKSWNNVWLFDDECEAGIRGGVYPNVYEEFEEFSYTPLPRVNMESCLTKNEINVLEFVKRYYHDIYTTRTLEDICRLEEPYKLAMQSGSCKENCKAILSKQDIEKYYIGIMKKYNISSDNQNHVKKYLNDLLVEN